jgi:Flp pilus assembly protein TadG
MVEFAVTFPFYLLMLCAIFDYSWYFYQRGVVGSAARAGCEAAAQGDPDQEDVAVVAVAVMLNSLAGQAGIDCGDAVYACEVSVDDMHSPPNNPPRLVCDVTTNYRSLTGFLGDYNEDSGWGTTYFREQWGWETNGRLIPGTMTGRAVSIFEESD